MKIESLIYQYDFNYAYALALVSDLNDSQMTIVPAKGLINHAAFTLGHLISGSALVAKKLGAAFEMKENWKDLFLRKGPGDIREPAPDKGQYPSKSELLTELHKQHEIVKSYLTSIDAEILKNRHQWRFEVHMPYLYDYLLFMCINHEAMHLGQLAAWRRAMNLPPVLSTL